MSDPFDPMDIFNGKKFADCYAWDKIKILEFLKEVVDDPETYGITTEQSKEDVKLLEEKISGLTDFADPPGTSIYFEPEPKQQVLREADATGKLSLEPTRAIIWDANVQQEPFYIIFDLLGSFLSLITSAATGSSSDVMAKRYFLPLVVLYAKWCFELRASNKKSPTAIQVTWFEARSKLWPFFGASIAGSSNPKDAVAAKEWETEVQKTRWDYLFDGNMLPAGYTTFEDSPKVRKDKDGGTKFGNCGETYPFLYILRDSLVKSSYGISVSMAGLFPKRDKDPRYTTYNGKPYWEDPRVMWPPCDNCGAILAKAGADPMHYQLYKS